MSPVVFPPQGSNKYTATLATQKKKNEVFGRVRWGRKILPAREWHWETCCRRGGGGSQGGMKHTFLRSSLRARAATPQYTEGIKERDTLNIKDVVNTHGESAVSSRLPAPTLSVRACGCTCGCNSARSLANFLKKEEIKKEKSFTSGRGVHESSPAEIWLPSTAANKGRIVGSREDGIVLQKDLSYFPSLSLELCLHDALAYQL